MARGKASTHLQREKKGTQSDNRSADGVEPVTMRNVFRLEQLMDQGTTSGAMSYSVTSFRLQSLNVNMAASEEIMKLFSDYEILFAKDLKIHEEVYTVVKALEGISRKISALLQRLHLPGMLDKVSEILLETRQLLESCQPLYKQLAEIVPSDGFYKYHDSWKTVTQKLICAIALLFYLEKRELVTKGKAAEILSLKENARDGFHLDLEDYLLGLLALVSELARFTVTCATSGNYELPLSIAKFVSELNAGFMLMNFKNDFLRKRYDALKYDQKKIEEVVFDLSIRGLKCDGTSDNIAKA